MSFAIFSDAGECAGDQNEPHNTHTTTHITTHTPESGACDNGCEEEGLEVNAHNTTIRKTQDNFNSDTHKNTHTATNTHNIVHMDDLEFAKENFQPLKKGRDPKRMKGLLSRYACTHVCV
jgi:hypothetical protein